MNLKLQTAFQGGSLSKIAALSTGTTLLAASAGFAQTPTQPEPKSTFSTPIVAIVKVPAPWYAPKFVIASKMRDTIPQYQKMNGLVFKTFSFAREGGEFGGIYFWQDRAAAQAWFTPEWFARVQKERGSVGQVRYFEAQVSIDNTPGGTTANAHSEGVATVVEIDTPAGISREHLIQEFKLAVPTYQKIPGLMRKHFTISDTGAFGGIYLWKDEASAQAWFNAAWHARVRSQYGQNAKIQWFDTPILSPSTQASNVVSTEALTVAKQ